MSADPPRQQVVLVAAVAENGVIGVEGRLPWHLPEDLAHFRRLTTGHVVVMGRVTYESIGRPLPRRTNIVVTRDATWRAEGVTTAGSVEEALALARAHEGDVMVIGGAQVYAAAMPYADRQVLTMVRAAPEGDASYPPVDAGEWVESHRDVHDSFDVVHWVRRDRGAAPAGDSLAP